MKYKTTRKKVSNGYNYVISVGYCELQYLLDWESPVAYTCNSYGWGSDIYDFGNIAIVTGYAPFGNREANYAICRKYDLKAEEIIHDHKDNRDKKAVLRNLINEFINEVCA